MDVRCPQCHNPIEVASDTKLSDIACSTCGSSFSLLGEETIDLVAGKPEAVGHFELVERLGVGSFGSVWKALDTELDRTRQPGWLKPTDFAAWLKRALR